MCTRTQDKIDKAINGPLLQKWKKLDKTYLKETNSIGTSKTQQKNTWGAYSGDQCTQGFTSTEPYERS